MLVAPVLAVQGPTKLFDPVVSPGAGTPSTTITFQVAYRNREGSAPAFVSVVIDGTAHRMTSTGGTTWKSGVQNRWSTTLPAGTHTVSFTATSRDKFSDTVSAGVVTITVPASPKPNPTPKPNPRPAPTPEPASTPTPAPAATPAPTDASAPGGPFGDPSDTPGPGSGATGAGGTGADGSGTDGIGSGGSGTGGDAGAGSWWSDGSGDGSGRSTDLVGIGAPGMAGPGPGSAVGPGGEGPSDATGGGTTTSDASGDGRDVVTGGPGWGALATALAALGIDRPPAITILPMLVGTSTAMTMAFAFAIFGKKRRDEQPPAPDEVLQANAARGHAIVPASQIVLGATVAPPLDLEAGMPRWRRPSLLEARKADPTRSVASPHRMSFENGVVGPVEGRERRIVRYAVVRLLDAPDELRSAEIGQLDQGDEVQLMERSGSYWLVLCPDGRQGWLHRMTLGEIVSDAASSGFAREIDDDVLSAFLAAHARA